MSAIGGGIKVRIPPWEEEAHVSSCPKIQEFNWKKYNKYKSLELNKFSVDSYHYCHIDAYMGSIGTIHGEVRSIQWLWVEKSKVVSLPRSSWLNARKLQVQIVGASLFSKESYTSFLSPFKWINVCNLQWHQDNTLIMEGNPHDGINK